MSSLQGRCLRFILFGCKRLLGLDSQLITDRTCFVAESLDQNAKQRSCWPAGCGGWSKRKTLFGADRGPGRELELLDPAAEAAKGGAIFLHPEVARMGGG